MDKENLERIIRESENGLNRLKEIKYEKLEDVINNLEKSFKEFREASEELIANNDTLQIGIVGQVKAGKSSFLNSLFFNGENVLPKASTPMTAGLTIIEYAEENAFEVEYFNQKDWDVFVKDDDTYRRIEQDVKKENPDAPESLILKTTKDRAGDQHCSSHEMVSNCSSNAKRKIGSKNDVQKFSDFEDLQNVLEKYVGANGEYTSVVKSLYIKMKDDRLKGLRIVDTPGVNDPVVSREERTRIFLHSCHGVFLLSASTDFLGSKDVSFLNTRIGGSGIGSVVLLASKFDSVLQDIGADVTMNGSGEADLVDTIEKQTKKFKKRLRDLQDTIDEKLRGKIKLDTTSGIGYSIAKKATSDWDAVEKQVVQQMKRFYPDYFSTDEDIKTNFEGLANMIDIREKYLDEVFMKNKESIIKERIKEFYDKGKEEIKLAIEKYLKYYERRREELKQTSLAEIEEQKKSQKEMFNTLKESFTNTFDDFAGGIQNQIRSMHNDILFEEIRTIPEEETQGSIEYYDIGIIYNSHETTTMSYKHVDINTLREKVKKSIEDYARSWNNEWKKFFEKSISEMTDELLKKIADYKKGIQSKTFKDQYYKNIIDFALRELKYQQEIGIGEIITECIHKGDDIINDHGQYFPSGTSDLQLNALNQYIQKQFSEHKKNLLNEFRNVADAIRGSVKKEVNANQEKVSYTMSNMKSSFHKKLDEQGEEYLKGLEEDLKEGKKSLDEIEGVIVNLKELSKLYA